MDQSQWPWTSKPENKPSLPSNSSFSVSTNRLLPKRRGTRKGVVLAALRKRTGVGGLVDVVVALFADFPKGLDADRQFQ